jgi:hypothetical protein
LRRNHPALQQGTQEFLPSLPSSVICYTRQFGEESILVALNFSALPIRIHFPVKYAKNHWEKIISSSTRSKSEIEGNTITLRGYEAMLFEKTGKQ